MKKEFEYIIWVDSAMESGWKDLSDGYIGSEHIVHSVGFAICEDDKTICLAHNYSDETENFVVQANGIMTIPKCCIKERVTYPAC